MGRWALRRAGQAVLTLLVALTLIWFAVTVLPGDPVRALFGFRQPTPEAYARVQEQLRLDEPVLVQYVLYLRDVLVLDLGETFPRDPFGRPDPGASVMGVLRGKVSPRSSTSTSRR
jgi:oligopeptide transport system permease protein